MNSILHENSVVVKPMESQKIIDCLKCYLRNMPAHLKETKRQLDLLGFYRYDYNRKIEYLAKARKQLYIERKLAKNQKGLQQSF